MFFLSDNIHETTRGLGCSSLLLLLTLGEDTTTVSRTNPFMLTGFLTDSVRVHEDGPCVGVIWPVSTET